MKEIEFKSDVTVELIDMMGSEQRIVQAARVSTKGAHAEAQEAKGLVKFLVREKHEVPLEHCVMTFRIHAPIFVTRQILKHRMCLSGDTRVKRVDRNGASVGGLNNQLKKMWQLWHVGARREPTPGKVHYALLPNRKDMWVKSVNEGTGDPHISRVADIVKNGVRETYQVVTESGRRIRATLDHKFLTPEGWKTLGEIGEGGYLLRESKVAANPERWVPPRLREGISLWATAMRKELVSYRGENCYICGEFQPFEDLELDHEVPVVENLSLALDEKNLRPACSSCHRAKTGRENSIRPRMGSKFGTRPDKIVFLGDPKKEETYDLVLEDPWHNFIAEGVVTHNSSISEESGRYRELDPVFYTPAPDRKVKQVGKTGDYEFVDDEEVNDRAYQHIALASRDSWESYETLLSKGAAKEVARVVLSTNLYSTMYMTINLRSALNFIALRTARYGSHPQHEIALVGEQVRDVLAEHFPTVLEAWEARGA